MLGTLDIEKEFVNHLAYKDSLDKIIRESVSEELFQSSETKNILQFVLDYTNKSGKSPTAEVLQTQYTDVTFTEPLSSVEWVIEQLKDRYERVQIYDLVVQVANKQDQPEEAFKILREGAAIIESNTLSKSHVWDLREDFGTFFGDYREEIIQNGTRKGYSLGFKDIDSFTGGLRKGRLGVIAARPKRQKTFFMIQAFLEQIKQGYSPVFFTLELLDAEIFLRALCLITGFSLDKAEKGNISTKEEWKRLEEDWYLFMDSVPGTPQIVLPKPGERTVPQLMLVADKLEADSIFISQLKQVQPLRFYKNKFDAYNEIVLDLKQAAIRPGSERPILLEAQLNREAQNIKEMEKLDLAQLGLTDAIGQTADVIFGIVQSQEHLLNSTVEFGIIEARHHGKQSWIFQYDYFNKTELRCIGVQ